MILWMSQLGPFEISWSKSDYSKRTFTILRDGVIIQSGSWNGSIYITTEATILDVGSYNFTLLVVDFSVNVSRDIVFVNILKEDTTQPPVSSPTSDQTSTTPQTTSEQFLVLIIGIAVLFVVKGPNLRN